MVTPIVKVSLFKLNEEMHQQLTSYAQTDRKQPFAFYMIQAFIQGKPDLIKVAEKLQNIWNAVEYTQLEIAEVYRKFLNDVYQAHHIVFWVETQKIIDKVTNGDATSVGNISEQKVKVERVVDIVQAVFNLPMVASIYQVSHPQQQNIIHNLLSKVKVEYINK